MVKVEGKTYKTKEEFLADWEICKNEMSSFLSMLDNKPASGALRSLFVIDEKVKTYADNHERTWNRHKE